MVATSLSLRGRALRLLATREHSRLELERKLMAHQTEVGELSHLLDDLQARGLIDEQRVLESLLHRRAARLGAARVRQELQAKGLDACAVAQAVDQLRGSEVQRARAVWEKKFGTPAADAAGRGKQMRFLLGRGFAADVVRRVVGGAEDADADA
ncbi:recombination regulator RecX [Hydrogenophaga sp.]|uniref:recombination regulator RecX n=1 Tax=Hydrogenophaga sp. TaxID=1904254 RepID=UPI0019BEEA0F|nr:recombination regulator RecX [Hydrogenophaga sp.]MBD3892681.1 recombination regulator RecX [Hydrogenophaga sp.]